MTAVVDTNVIAYYLLGTKPYADEAGAFWRQVDYAIAPAHWRAELANVVWMAVRSGVLQVVEGHRRLDLAGRLGVESVAIDTLWQRALSTAVTADVAVYDTLFVELAKRRNLPLVTFDARMLRSFPEIARRPGAVSTR